MSEVRAIEIAARRRLLDELLERIALTELRDRPRLRARIERLTGARLPESKFVAQLAEIERDIERSAARVLARTSTPLRLGFDPLLPITAHRAEIAAAIEGHPFVIVCGETGSGKSTQLPKICLEAGRGSAGLIGHTQPRRIAARAIADRVASELGVALGAEVGYQVRFTDRSGPRSRVKLMTDGILLRELERDRELRRYDTLIIDEAHERTLNVDFLLGYLKKLVPRRPDLRVVLTSATIDTERFAEFFDGAPVVNVSGRSYPVEVIYRPLAGAQDDDPAERTLLDGLNAAIHEIVGGGAGDGWDAGRGDVLVFLPGEKQIREGVAVLERQGPAGIEILPLYARQSAAEQSRVFEPHQQQRVILATNVAETSLTVPGVRYVVDSGLARISRYSARTHVQRLPVEPVSQASADQRKGRCGREGPGLCVRLYSAEDFLSRERETPPEILRTNLASVILQMAVLGLGDPQDFPFLDPPDVRAIGDGYRLLEELGAVDQTRRVTNIGRQMAALPVDPRLARVLIAAASESCLAEVLIIAAFLSIQDPRERSDARNTAEAADASPTITEDERSDFMTVLNLWNAYQEVAPESSGNALRRWCKARGLAFLRMREWQDLVAQLSDTCRELDMRENERAASYKQLHRSLLTGFLGQVGHREERREYVGPRGHRFVIAPGTPLAQRPPRWVVAASLIETTRVYARTLASVEPAWIESAAGPLLRRSYSEPHWLAARGYVAAFETVRLYGLVLGSRRRINYGRVDPAHARHIFVMHALVLGDGHVDAPFLATNRALQRQIEDIEARLRRRDVLVGEEARAAFYLDRIPERISSTSAFEAWRREAERAQPRLLHMSLPDLMTRPVDPAELAGFPDTWRSAGNEYPLRYRFDPAADDDGVTLTVPVPFVAALDPGELAWLVPGLRHEKIVALMRGLPKGIRRRLVPVPDCAAEALQEIEADGDFHTRLAAWLQRRTGETVTPDMLAAIAMPDHLKMNLRVVDESGRAILMGRDLAAIRRALKRDLEAGPGVQATAPEGVSRVWDFGPLPETLVVARGGSKLTVHPGLEDVGSGVRRIDYPTRAQAHLEIRKAIRRLAILALPQQWKYARKAFADRRELMLLGAVLDLDRPFADLLAERVFRECFDPDGEPSPRSEPEFLARLEAGRGQIGEAIDGLGARVEAMLRTVHDLRQRLAGLVAPAFEPAVAEIRDQLERYLPRDFPVGLTQQRLENLPRYLTAVTRRLGRLRGAVDRDRRAAAQLAPFLVALTELERRARSQGLNDVPALAEFERLIDEYRVSLFAQELGTAVPVSGKRLDAQLERARAALERR